jgi:ribosomal RNA methyltransferase Nop2
MELFSPAECAEYMEASDRPRPLVIRTNTLKINRKDLMEALNKRGCNVEAIEWSKVAIKVTESSVPIGATPEYLSGRYMLQSAASLNPVMALAPKPDERILDMSCAPGGKTSYMAQMMKNSGTVIANDLKPLRQKATVANLHRMGVKNAIVCCYDGRKIPQIMKSFDRVLLDAPCSGLGVIARDPSVKLQRTVKDIQRMSHLQKELLCAAVDVVDPRSPSGGIIVYSTCSISTEENEQVIDFILRKRYVRLVDTGLEVGKPGFTRHKERRFHPSLALTRRFYPHVHNMDGFYVAKLQKYANGVKTSTDDDEEDEEVDDEEVYDENEERSSDSRPKRTDDGIRDDKKTKKIKNLKRGIIVDHSKKRSVEKVDDRKNGKTKMPSFDNGAVITAKSDDPMSKKQKRDKMNEVVAVNHNHNNSLVDHEPSRNISERLIPSTSLSDLNRTSLTLKKKKRLSIGALRRKSLSGL